MPMQKAPLPRLSDKQTNRQTDGHIKTETQTFGRTKGKRERTDYKQIDM